jgi:hypothetical protein
VTTKWIVRLALLSLYAFDVAILPQELYRVLILVFASITFYYEGRRDEEANAFSTFRRITASIQKQTTNREYV